MTKQAIVNAFRAFINQRSGIEFANYQSGDWKHSREAFMGDYRPILKHGRHARTLLKAVEHTEGITAEMLADAAKHSYSGRLSLIERGDKVGVDYCTGQYFPTEYRNAACAVLASALWHYVSANYMPKPTYKHYGSADSLPMQTVALYDGLSAGDWLRRWFRREFGRAIQQTWFS